MTQQYNKTKVALVGYTLANGGLERVFSSVSSLLHDAGCEVSVIVLEDIVAYRYSGRLINLGHYSKFQKYFRLRKELKTNQFDYIIDFRHRINPWMELLFLQYIYAGFKSIYTIHSSKLDVYLTNNKWVAQQILQKVYKVVTVSKGLKEKIKTEYAFSEVIVIPNSVASATTEGDCQERKLPYKYCIAVGRLVSLKQFDQLIEAYAKSNLPTENIHLVILGDGEEKERLQIQIEQLQLNEFIHLLGFKEQVFCYIQHAEFLVLSSKYEGFSMVILEALSLSTPVVSFDCEAGPRELVQHEYNGLLVDNQNFEALTKALNAIIDNKVLYTFCKSNAKASVIEFSSGTVASKWLHLLNH